MDGRLGQGGPQHGGGMGGIFPQDRSLENDVLEAINREIIAANFYNLLIQFAPNQYIQTILGIIRDERMKHYHWFTNIYIAMTGRQPIVHPQLKPAPRNFAEGLHVAIRDELDAVSFYQDIVDRAVSPRIKRQFERAAQDEQRHANLFMNMLASIRS